MVFLRTVNLLAGLLLSSSTFAYEHEAGKCMLNGQCGKESFFGAQLPCPYNGPALVPDTPLRNLLVDICGENYSTGPVCCDQSQVEALQSNLKKADSLIASCPACQHNFYDFFCTFTCSPNQSQFLTIEETAQSDTGETIATHVSQYVSPESADGFFQSCKDVKFSATNDYVMTLIGGGAVNASEFLRFLGHKSPLGSPMQIDFPTEVPKYMTPIKTVARPCADLDPQYRCACVDCPQVCPELPPTADLREVCRVGVLPCFSFGVILIYVLGLVAFIGGFSAHSLIQKQFHHQSAGLRLANRIESFSEDETILGVQDDSPRTYMLNDYLYRVFYRAGYACAKFPYATIGCSIVLAFFLSLGSLKFGIETNPVRLWVSPQSPAAQEKAFFDQNFGPFYRTQQIFLVNDTTPSASVVTYDNLKFWFDLETKLRAINANGTHFEDVCFKPTGDACVIQSITGYWQGDFDSVDRETWQDDLEGCASQPVNCLPDFQQPLKSSIVLGGSEQGILRSQAFISSIVLANSRNETRNHYAELWEKQLKLLLLEAQIEAQDRGLRLSLSTESSLEEELNKSTNTDAKIVLISYIAMFLYSSVALGSPLYKGKRSLINSKFSLGLFGIMLVLLSISVSVGVFSVLGIKVTLIIAEVIPFLVLAVGVDNIFLICHEFDRVNARHSLRSIEERVASTMGNMVPSILLSACSETVAFALGAFAGMPAVRNFAIYAAGAVFFNAVLQIVMLPAALAINQLRVEANRVDCAPFFRLDSSAMNDVEEEAFLPGFIRKRYAPFLLRRHVKVAIVFLFGSLVALSLALCPRIQLGLDQKVALPRDSYLIDYFRDLEKYLGTGPPVYFVVEGANATARETQQAICGRFTTCDEFSMTNILEQERKRPEVSYLLEPAGSWIDDFFYWLKPELDQCCRVQKRDPRVFCSVHDSENACQACFQDHEPPWNVTMTGLPEGNEFLDYASTWLQSPTNEDCPLAGKATFGDAVVLDLDKVSIKAFNARTFHVPLRSQDDFINSYAAARRISTDISSRTGLRVFPYAVHYIFFDQYATIIRLTVILVGSALVAIWVISTVLLGSFTAASLITITVAMIVIDIAGVMALWGISLNALSLVNLVICVGIGVEFCAHFAHSYMAPTNGFVNHVIDIGKNREQRTWNALISVGASVFSGITLCKFVGVVVLAFSRSKIFEIYYFRMWLALVFIAASHGLIFLPVLFSLLGPPGYVINESDSFVDNEWISTANGLYTDALLAEGASYDEDLI